MFLVLFRSSCLVPPQFVSGALRVSVVSALFDAVVDDREVFVAARPPGVVEVDLFLLVAPNDRLLNGPLDVDLVDGIC